MPEPCLYYVKRRVITSSRKICFLRTALPTGEEFYLRLLLLSRPMRNFADLLIRREGDDGGEGPYKSFQEAALAHGLYVPDDEAALAMEEARTMLGATPDTLRRLYVTLLHHCPNTNSLELLPAFFHHMVQDYNQRMPLHLRPVQHQPARHHRLVL